MDRGYKRTSDGQTVRRYRCKTCGKRFSAATRRPLKWQKSRSKSSLKRSGLILFYLNYTWPM